MIGLVQYWYLPDTALSQKRLRFWHSLKWTALSVNRVVSLHIGCCRHLKQLSQWFLGLIPCRTQILRKVCPKMKCSLNSDGHDVTPFCCVHIEVFHFVSRTETISLSHNRENLLHVRYAFPQATSLHVLFESSGKFRCSWFSSVATSLLVFSSRTAPFLSRLRTRRCVLIVFSCSRSPCTSPIILTAQSKNL